MLAEGHGKTWGDRNIPYLDVVMILLMYTYFRITELYAFNGYSLLYINYASMVDFFKSLRKGVEGT